MRGHSIQQLLRYVTFQLAKVAVSKNLFPKVLGLIDELRRKPAPA